MPKRLKDGDYILTENAGWFEAPGKPASVRLRFLGDCVEVTTYINGREDELGLETVHLPYPSVGTQEGA